jgi:uncharacterized membrane protein
MASVDKEIMVNAPLEKIYNFLIKPSSLMQIWPSLIEVKNEQLLPNGGYSAKWVYKMAGIYLKGKAECTDVVHNQWFSVKVEGAVDCTMTWTFRTKDNIVTKVTITLDYKVHFPLLNRLAEIIIVKMNEHEAELVLANLLLILE